MLSDAIEDINIRPIYLYFSPDRSISQNTIEANLSSENYQDLLADYLGSTSRSNSSLLRVSANYFATKRRKLEGYKKKGYESMWKDDEEVKLVTKYLKKLQYSWSLGEPDIRKNIYKQSGV